MMVGDGFVGVGLLGGKTFVVVADFEAVAANAIRAADKDMAIVKDGRTDSGRSAFACSFPEHLAVISGEADNICAGELDVLAFSAILTGNE